MRRIRILTTAMAILAFGAIATGCAGANVGLSFGPNRSPVQNAGYLPAEEPDEEVADVPWERCDGECRYQESMRICSTTVQVAGAQRQHAHAAFMQFRDRTAFRARVMQSCAGGVRYAGNSRHGNSRGLSAADLANLQGIAKKVLGPVPGDARGYTARVTSKVVSPAPGCEKITERRAGGGTFDRWRCPRGTIKRLGW